MKKIAIGLFVVGIVIGAIVTSVLFQGRREVVDAQVVQNLKLVTFANGVTRVLYHDYDYSSMAPGWDISTTIDAVNSDDGRQLTVFHAPEITFQGSNWQREVYTYATEWNGCQKNILYINRDAKSEETFHKVSVPFCIRQTLDTRDVSQFFGVSDDGMTVAVGNYRDGSVVAQTTLPIPGTSLATANWENTKLLFGAGECDLGGDTLQLFLWDTVKGTLTDMRPSLNIGSNCGLIDAQSVVYNHDTDAFDIYDNGRGDLPYLFSVK